MAGAFETFAALNANSLLRSLVKKKKLLFFFADDYTTYVCGGREKEYYHFCMLFNNWAFSKLKKEENPTISIGATAGSGSP